MRSRNLRTHIALAPVALATCLALGCGLAPSPAERAVAEQGLSGLNGLSPNGLSMNGLSMNGLSMNGLSMNGLSMNGLSTLAFSTWFNKNVQLGDVVMQYLVRCAVPSGQSRTFTNPTNHATYTWNGLFGLAPGWAGGAAATTAEQQVITGCVAAHLNKYGVHVSVSLQGKSSTGVAIPLEWNELSTYSVKEGCFFGNLFNGDGVFVGMDHTPWDEKYSSARACALDYAYGPSPDCSPLVIVGDCDSRCTLDASGNFYTSCSYNGKSYKPITTRLRSQDIYRCGDGTCQFTEECGWGSKWDDCRADCGSCYH